jgi:hypothetical protein
VDTQNHNAEAVWENTAMNNLWRVTLSAIQSVFGRLVYLSSLRDVNNDQYRHHGLATLYGELETDRALRESHEQVFAEWLTFPLEQQRSDLDIYLSSLNTPRRTLLQTWQRLAPYRNMIPTSAMEPERNLYLLDVETLLESLRSEYVSGLAASRRR